MLQSLVLVDLELSSDFLEVLPRLQELKLLTLDMVWMDPSPVAAYSALTASSKLQSLSLDTCFEQGTWQHIFNRQLHLTSVNLCDPGRNVDDVLTLGDLQRVVHSCPALQQLDVAGVMPKGPEASEALMQLSALTSLTGTFEDGQAPSLAQLLTPLQPRDPTGSRRIPE